MIYTVYAQDNTQALKDFLQNSLQCVVLQDNTGTVTSSIGAFAYISAIQMLNDTAVATVTSSSSVFNLNCGTTGGAGAVANGKIQAIKVSSLTIQ